MANDQDFARRTLDNSQRLVPRGAREKDIPWSLIERHGCRLPPTQTPKEVAINLLGGGVSTPPISGHMTGQTTFSPSPGLETKASSKPNVPAADPHTLPLTTLSSPPLTHNSWAGGGEQRLVMRRWQLRKARKINVYLFS